MGDGEGSVAGVVLTERPGQAQLSTDVASLRRTYAGRRVLVTGHTGFKGAWLAFWLARLGADVHGISLAPDGDRPNLFTDGRLAVKCVSRLEDIRDAEAVSAAVSDIKPEFVFHLAARALVQQGYEDPLATFATNIMGTANVLEAARATSSVRAVVCVTTDKVYRNHEWPWPYRETDELGGLDAYAASKAGAEMVARAYRHALRPGDRPFALATARGGNVLGGGDFSPHRLVPDIVRALTAGKALALRNPQALRPWQHVLDLCHGYLRLGSALTQGGIDDVEAVNFGPVPGGELPVRDLVDAFLAEWGKPDQPVEYAPDTRYEATTLRLDSSQAAHRLGWVPMLDTRATLAWSARWYRAHAENPGGAAKLVDADLAAYEALLERTDDA